MRKAFLLSYLLVLVITNAFSSPLRKQLELAVQDSATNAAGVASFYFAAGTSPNYIANEDIRLLIDTTGGNPQLFTYSADNVALTSNSFGTLNNTNIVRMGVSINNAGTYIFSVQQFSNFDPASLLFLEDRLLNITIDLRRTPYKVNFNQRGMINNRFYLHVTYPPVITSIPAGCTNHDGIISIREDNSVVWSVCNVFDSTSALVATDTNLSGNHNFTGLPGGNYRVEFNYSIYSPIQYIQVDEHQLISGMNVSNNHDRVFQNIQFFTPGSNATQFRWDFGDGSVILGVANPTYSYLQPGTYVATVNCSNEFGCSGTSDTVMYIDESTSIDQIDGNTVKIVSGKNSIRISLDNPSATNYNYSIYNVEGQELMAGPISQPELSLNLGNQASGIYIVNIRSTESSLSQKVMITN